MHAARGGTYTFEVSASTATSATSPSRSGRCSAPRNPRPTSTRSSSTTDGNFLFAAADVNRLNGQPARDHGLPGPGRLQLVIAKASTDPGTATQLRYMMFERRAHRRVRAAAGARDLRTRARAAAPPRSPPTTRSGRSCRRTSPPRAAICRSCSTPAAIACPQPDVRRVPQIAAADGGNTTFFVTDSIPRRRHAAELLRDERRCAARRGHRRARAPGERRAGIDHARRRCARSCRRARSPHDLDPYHAEGAPRRPAPSPPTGHPGLQRRESRPEARPPRAR